MTENAAIFNSKPCNRDCTTESIRVLVRVRPFNVFEINKQDESEKGSVNVSSSKTLIVENIANKKVFQCEFDSVWGPQSRLCFLKIFALIKSSCLVIDA